MFPQVSVEYSARVDALVVWFFATVLAMNDRPLATPQLRSFLPRPEGVAPSGFFRPVIDRNTHAGRHNGMIAALALLPRRPACFVRLQ